MTEVLTFSLGGSFSSSEHADDSSEEDAGREAEDAGQGEVVLTGWVPGAATTGSPRGLIALV